MLIYAGTALPRQPFWPAQVSILTQQDLCCERLRSGKIWACMRSDKWSVFEEDVKKKIPKTERSK